MLFFHHKDGTTRLIKERNRSEIIRFISKYYGDYFFQKYKYLGNQHISENNGNIYADFENITENYVTTLFLCDYNDYKIEIDKATYV